MKKKVDNPDATNTQEDEMDHLAEFIKQRSKQNEVLEKLLNQLTSKKEKDRQENEDGK